MPGCDSSACRWPVLALVILPFLAAARDSDPVANPANLSPPKTNTCHFRAVVKRERPQGCLAATHAEVECGQVRFAFLIPEALKPRITPSDDLVFFLEDHSCIITIRPVVSEVRPDTDETLAGRLSHETSRFEMLEQGKTHAAGMSGEFVEFLEEVNRLKRRSRVVRFPVGEDWIEFRISCPPADYEGNVRLFLEILTNLRAADGDEPLDVPRLPENSQSSPGPFPTLA
jgi:hypothetical protein